MVPNLPFGGWNRCSPFFATCTTFIIRGRAVNKIISGPQNFVWENKKWLSNRSQKNYFLAQYQYHHETCEKFTMKLILLSCHNEKVDQ